MEFNGIQSRWKEVLKYLKVQVVSWVLSVLNAEYFHSMNLEKLLQNHSLVWHMVSIDCNQPYYFSLIDSSGYTSSNLMATSESSGTSMQKTGNPHISKSESTGNVISCLWIRALYSHPCWSFIRKIILDDRPETHVFWLMKLTGNPWILRKSTYFLWI